jgi:sporulation protein YlmC with PRC-barrel domain
MQLSTSSLRLQPILDAEEKEIITIMKKAIVTCDKGLFLGVICVGGKAVAFNDLLWHKEKRYFYVHSKDALCEIAEILRLDKANRDKNYFRKQKVVNEDGKKLGVLKDVVIDPIQGVLVAIAITRRIWFSSYELFIHRNNILESSSKFIKIRNGAAREQKKAVPELRTALNSESN